MCVVRLAGSLAGRVGDLTLGLTNPVAEGGERSSEAGFFAGAAAFLGVDGLALLARTDDLGAWATTGDLGAFAVVFPVVEIGDVLVLLEGAPFFATPFVADLASPPLGCTACRYHQHTSIGANCFIIQIYSYYSISTQAHRLIFHLTKRRIFRFTKYFLIRVRTPTYNITNTCKKVAECICTDYGFTGYNTICK